MKITLLCGDMLPNTLKREKLFDLVWMCGRLKEAPTRSPIAVVGALVRGAPLPAAPHPIDLALNEFRELVARQAPEANYVLCTRVERTMVTAGGAAWWDLMITGTPAVLISVC